MDQDLIAVVGGGVTGSAVAVHLADRGARPVVIDAEPVRGRQTAPSFGAISGFGRRSPSQYQAACVALALWPAFARRLGPGIGFRRGGEVRWASQPEEAATLASGVAEAERLGYPIRTITASQLGDLLPGVRPGAVQVASWAWHDAQVEPDRLVAACHAALDAAGVRRIAGEVARLGLDDDGPYLAVGEELLRPSTVVLAAGAASPLVTAALGLELPTVASPGRLIVTDPVAPIGDRVVYPPSGPGPAVHLRQRLDGTVLVGEGSQETVTTDLSMRRAREVVRQAAQFFPALAEARPKRLLLGWRPMPADRQPMIGRLPGLPWLYVALVPTAVTLAPVVGRLVAEQLVDGAPDGAPDPLLDPFRPLRFADPTLDVMASVETVLRHPGRGRVRRD